MGQTSANDASARCEWCNSCIVSMISILHHDIYLINIHTSFYGLCVLQHNIETQHQTSIIDNITHPRNSRTIEPTMHSSSQNWLFFSLADLSFFLCIFQMSDSIMRRCHYIKDLFMTCYLFFGSIVCSWKIQFPESIICVHISILKSGGSCNEALCEQIE